MAAESGDVLLIRHAQSAGNVDTTWIQGRSNHLDITALGERQAARVGSWLKRTYGTPDAVVMSPAVRTVRTAEIALQAAGMEVVPAINGDLQELSQGDWEGAVRTEKWTPEVLAQMSAEGLDYASPGGESMRGTAERMSDACSQLPEGRVWAFTHGLAIRCLVGVLVDWDHPAILEHRHDMYNTSVTRIRRASDGLQLGHYALAEHLPPDMRTI